MKTVFSIALLILLALRINVCAQDSTRALIALHFGYTNTDFSWSIAGNAKGTSPNVRSELIWKNIRTAESKLDLRFKIWKALHINSSLSYGKIVSGSATDSDYEQDNRTARTFYAALQADKGNMFSFYPALSYVFSVSRNLVISPALGYGISKQKLFLLDNSGLNSTYEPKWTGPFGSLNIQSSFSKNFKLATSVIYHQVNYHANANWNLIENFQHPLSFRHTAKGFGIEGILELSYYITNSFAVSIAGNLNKWTTGAGIDQLFLTDGKTPKTRLNDVTKKSYGINVGACYSFGRH